MQFQSHRRRTLLLLIALLVTLAAPLQPATAQLGPVQFDYDLQNLTGQLSMAGAVHVPGNPGEFWVSRWSSTELYRISESGVLIEGPFTVPGVSGIRAMTWDGSLIWAANNTDVLYGIDPVTKTVVDTITITSGAIARFVTFDGQHVQGAGFWVGNFSTGLSFVTYDGFVPSVIGSGVLEDIPMRYGCVRDTVSPGGPYFWFFHQSTPPSGASGQAWISRLDGIDVDYSFSVSDALGGVDSDLAGGLFLTSGLVPGELTLGGVLQSGLAITDRLFGLRLATSGNDSCESAQLIECNASVIADNTSATNDISDPGFSCHFSGPGTQGENTLWYMFEATDTSAYITTCNTTDPIADDSLIAVYEGTCGSLTEIGCSEDKCELLSEVCVFALTPGETYYIQLASFDTSDVGPYTLEVACPCPQALCATESVYSFTPADTEDGFVLFTLADSDDSGTSWQPHTHGDNFIVGDSPITSLTIWPNGALYPTPAQPCSESMGVEVTFHLDAGGFPGDVVCAYESTLANVPGFTGSSTPTLMPFVLDLLTLGGSCDLDAGWVVIQGFGGDPDCHMALAVPRQNGETSVFDNGIGYGFFSGNVLAMCLGTDDQVGACCIELEPCVMTDSANCAALAGTFQGQGTTCASAGCGYTVMQEPFLYASDVALEAIWDGADSETVLYGLRTAFGTPNNSYQCNDRAFTTFSRLRYEFDQDEKPGSNQALLVEFDLYLDPAGAPSNWAGANHWIEFGGHTGDDYGVGSKDNEIKFGIMNEADLSNWIDYDGTYFQAHIFSASTQFGYSLNAEPGAPLRSSGWHRLRCEVTPTTIGPSDAWQFSFYIDGTLAESIVRFGQAGFDWIRLGSGRPTNGHISYIDNVRVAIVPTVVSPPCPADIASSDGPGTDGTVNLFDLLLLLDNWGTSGAGAAISSQGGGLNMVDLFDLLALIDAWGDCD